MSVLSLNHYTLRSADLEATRRFYEEVVGLSVGARPPFNFPGYWLYGGDGIAILHLVGVDRPVSGVGGGAIDHLAFLCNDLAATKYKLTTLGIAFEQRMVPLTEMHQLFLTDPHGVRLELNFPA